MRVFYRRSLDKNRLDKNSLCSTLSAQPILARLLDKPRWQLMMWMSIALIILAGAAYWLVIHPFFQQRQQVSQEIVQQRQRVATQYRALLARPSRAQLDEKRHALLPQEQQVLPLTQQIAVPLAASKASLKQWSPQPAGESGSPRSVLKVQMAYPALAVFLQQLLAGNAPPAIEHLNLNAVSGALDIEMLLSASSYAAENPAVPRFALSRDPFSPQTVKQCLERHDELSQSVLKGIVGSDIRRTGWLAWPDGSWKKVQAGRHIAATDWLVDSVAADRIVLIRQMLVDEGSACDEQRKLMSLHPEKPSGKRTKKAGQYDMDDQQRP